MKARLEVDSNILPPTSRNPSIDERLTSLPRKMFKSSDKNTGMIFKNNPINMNADLN